ncbi:MAG: transcriptional repressor [Kiritimatiellae bacterium]|nr:transcriptional repressor [Kiritimatiellia bacterium]
MVRFIPMPSSADIHEILAGHGIRPSRSRIAVYANLAARCDHPRAEDVYRDLSPALTTLSRTTVYSTLSLFCKKNLAREVFTGENEMRFDAKTFPHAHLFCRKCGMLADAPLPSAFPARAPACGGWTLADVQLTYSGLCPRCSAACCE